MRLTQRFTRMSGFRSPVKAEVAAFTGEVTSLPGCPVVGVSHAVYKMHGEKGHGRAAFIKRAEQMRELGYAVMLCTVVSDNAPQRAILESEGAHKALTFHNPQTGNDVVMYVYPLTRG